MPSKLPPTRSWTVRCWTLTLCLMLGGGSFTTASAQTPPVTSVEAGKPFKVAFDHDGVNVTHYRLLLNDQQVVEVPASARVDGVVTVDMAPLPLGAYSLVAIARNAPTAPFTDPSESRSAPYAFEVRTTAPTPNPPAWRVTSVFTADGRGWIESIVALETEPVTLRLSSPK